MGCKSSKYSVEEPKNTRNENPEDKKRLASIIIRQQDFIKEVKGQLLNDYKIISTLGKGGYGEVKKGVHRKTGEVRAIKIISKQKAGEEKLKQIMAEVSIVRGLDHPNIMKIIEFYQDSDRLYIVGEYYSGGDLFEKIATFQTFTEKQAAVIMKQMLSAVNYCHKNKIVHRDIKPENIVYEAPESNALKLIDFGTSTEFSPNVTMTKALGTAYYIAPEVLAKKYTEKCDVWSCGVVLYILLCGRPPFSGANEKKILDAVMKAPLKFADEDWYDKSKSAQDLIRQMLERDPNKRLSAGEALDHPWIRDSISNNAGGESKHIATALGNLKNFRAERKLQEAVWIFLAGYFSSKDEKAELKRVFETLDKNKDGTLTIDEIKNGYEKVFGSAIPDDELNAMIMKIDANKSGAVDYSEFVAACMDKHKLLSKERLEKTFALFDKDGNGYLTQDELKEFFGPIAVDEEAMRAIIQQVDMNNDGKISLKEFKSMMNNMLK